MNIYQALDNNGALYRLITDKATARRLADSHQKDAIGPIDSDWYPADTPVTNAKGRVIGTLAEVIQR